MLPVGGVDGVVCPGCEALPPVVLPPADPDPPACCATTQVAQRRTTERNVSFLADILKASGLEFLIPSKARGVRWGEESMFRVCACNDPGDIRRMR